MRLASPPISGPEAFRPSVSGGFRDQHDVHASGARQPLWNQLDGEQRRSPHQRPRFDTRMDSGSRKRSFEGETQGREYGTSRQLPYVSPEERYYAPLPERASSSEHDKSRKSGSSSNHSSRDPSVPPPQRPSAKSFPLAASHATRPSSRHAQQPPSPPSSRGQIDAYGYGVALGSREGPSDSRSPHRLFKPPSAIQPPHSQHRPLSPPSSRDRDHRVVSIYPAPLDRARSQSSQQSGYSASARRVSLTPSVSTSSEDAAESSSRTDRSAGAGADDVTSSLQRPKRTRVLMTHVQQDKLNMVWKLSKFPTTQEREEIAAEVGLTPRQVQVWFQNRRQTYRKQIIAGTVPENADPADYADLQKSPRSRRLSLEAANATMMVDGEEEDRSVVSQWASRTSSASSSYGSRSFPPQALSMRPDAPIERPYPRPPLSAGLSSTFSQNSPSPPRRYDNDPYRRRPPSSSWQIRPDTGSSHYRPETSSSSYSSPFAHDVVGRVAHARPQSRAFTLPVLQASDRRGSYWDDPPYASSQPLVAHRSTGALPSQITRSPVPFSPPPTAERLPHPFAYRPPSSHGGPYAYEHRAVSSGTDAETHRQTGTPPTRRQSPSPKVPRPSHLPPSLAALAITRPIDHDRQEVPRSAHVLPSLSIDIDTSPRENTAKDRTPTRRFDDGRLEVDMGDDRLSRSPNTPRPGSRQRAGLLLDGMDDPQITRAASLHPEHARERDSPAISSSSTTASLPRFGDLFK